MKARKYKLPLSVRSTAIRIFNLIVDDLERFRLKNDDLVMISIMIACKCEDVQGGIDPMLHRLGFDRRVELIKFENMILNHIRFNLYFTSPYTKVYAVLVLLQERDLLHVVNENSPEHGDLYYIERSRIVSHDIDRIWDKAIENIDYILCMDNQNWTEIEIAYAALEFPKELFRKLTFKYSEDKLEYLTRNVYKLRNELSQLT